jgi:drug/metabolite transporter (DMT)-like permease
MNYWVFFALLPAALWAADNYVDKHVLDKYLNKYDPGVLVLFLAISGLFISLIIPFFGVQIFSITSRDVIGLLISGVLFTLSTIPSSIALSQMSPTYIAALFRAGPIFTYVLALTFLNETLSTGQILGSLFVIVGAITLSIEMSGKGGQKKKLKLVPLLLMLLSSFMMAGNALIFKAVSRNELPFWQNIFWQHLGLFLGGAILFTIIKKYRRDFIECVRSSGRRVFIWSSASGFIGLGGRISFYYATLFAPLAVVSTLTSFQPAFSLLFGLILARFVKSYRDKKQSKEQLFQEIISIAIILTGTVVLLNF